VPTPTRVSPANSAGSVPLISAGDGVDSAVHGLPVVRQFCVPLMNSAVAEVSAGAGAGPATAIAAAVTMAKVSDLMTSPQFRRVSEPGQYPGRGNRSAGTLVVDSQDSDAGVSA